MNTKRKSTLAGAGDTRQLRDALDRLVGQSRRFLVRWRLRAELRAAAAGALLGLFVLPVALLLFRLTRGLLGHPQGTVSVWTVIGLAVLGPVLYILGRLLWSYFRYRPARFGALALYDAELKAQDRLVTADEFIDEESADATDHSQGFRQAAIEDAQNYARSALSAPLTPLALPAWHVRPLSWLGVPAAILAAVPLILGLDGSRAFASPDDKAVLAMIDASLPPDATPEDIAAARRDPRRVREAEKELQLAMLEKQALTPAKMNKTRNDKSPEGKANTGSASAAQASSNASNAAGEPSSQKNASKPKKPEEEKPEEQDDGNPLAKKKNPKKPEQKAAQMAMEATSGAGKMTMTNSSMTQFDMPEEEDKAGAGVKQGDQDQEAEDEDEEEKSSGVTRPSLRDKKPPVDRNLGTCPADKKKSKQPPNGRGGPGGRKKTRGVPSMILGVPVPDRVQGMVNAGRSKVTQEDAKPKEESHPSVEAQERLAREEAAGHVAHPALLPWMQSLVENYFTSLRQQTETNEPFPPMQR